MEKRLKSIYLFAMQMWATVWMTFWTVTVRDMLIINFTFRVSSTLCKERLIIRITGIHTFMANIITKLSWRTVCILCAIQFTADPRVSFKGFDAFTNSDASFTGEAN